MFKLYYASAIDTCVSDALKQIEEFKKIFNKKRYKDLEVYGAGFKGSPVLTPDSTSEFKGVVSAYDLRKIRECDILLVVTDLKQFAAGTMMELEYARNLGIYTVVLVMPPSCKECDVKERFPNYAWVDTHCGRCIRDKYPMKNIFIETYANKVLYWQIELEKFLEKILP